MLDQNFRLEQYLAGCQGTHMHFGSVITSRIIPLSALLATTFNYRAYLAPSVKEATGNPLFNGNISYTTLAMAGIRNDSTVGYTYGYDQLNRLVEMRQHGISGGWNNSNILNKYRESIAYDANGNILKYLRHGADEPW